jgi:hypothetical protein
MAMKTVIPTRSNTTADIVCLKALNFIETSSNHFCVKVKGFPFIYHTDLRAPSGKTRFSVPLPDGVNLDPGFMTWP